jgi:hypothetical protein
MELEIKILLREFSDNGATWLEIAECMAVCSVYPIRWLWREEDENLDG